MSLHDAANEGRSCRAAGYRAALVQGWRRSQRVVGRVLQGCHEAAEVLPDNVLVINGHPDTRPERFCAALCEAYAAGAGSRGAAVRTLEIGGLSEASAIKPGFQLSGFLRDDWARALETARWAHRYVVVFPLWLNEPPPLLRRFFESVAASGITGDDGFFSSRHTRKRARVVVTMEMPGFALRSMLQSGASAGQARRSLSFPGVEEQGLMIMGCVRSVSAAQRTEWLCTLRQLGVDGV